MLNIINLIYLIVLANYLCECGPVGFGAANNYFWDKHDFLLEVCCPSEKGRCVGQNGGQPNSIILS